METEMKKEDTGITDKNGIKIFENDDLILLFESLRMEGKAKMDDDGEWELYKDEGNHVGLLHNRERITIKSKELEKGAINIIFDGPPGPKSGRFIEVENDKRESISVGEWIDRKDGYWALRIRL